MRGAQNREIYAKTMEGLREKDKENKELGAKMSERLKAAEAAKQAPVAKVDTEAKPAAAAEEKFDASAELGSILKKSPSRSTATPCGSSSS